MSTRFFHQLFANAIGLIAGLGMTGTSIVGTAFAAGPIETKGQTEGKTESILGLSWQPAFCQSQGQRPECVGQTALQPDATQFSLVGLWPVGKTYCAVSAELKALDRKRDWMALPPVALSEDLGRRLAIAMPGKASGLDRHQWVRSGQCQSLGAEDYFALQVRLLDAVNASPVARLFRDNIGGEVTQAEVKAAFDEAFGSGAGDRVRMRCASAGDRSLVTGLTVGLSGDPAAADLGAVIRAAEPTQFKCAKGIVDAAGSEATLSASR